MERTCTCRKAASPVWTVETPTAQSNNNFLFYFLFLFHFFINSKHLYQSKGILSTKIISNSEKGWNGIREGNDSRLHWRGKRKNHCFFRTGHASNRPWIESVYGSIYENWIHRRNSQYYETQLSF